MEVIQDITGYVIQGFRNTGIQGYTNTGINKYNNDTSTQGYRHIITVIMGHGLRGIKGDTGMQG